MLQLHSFVILSRSRIGSNMLVQYLNSHPHIRCEYETLGILDNRSGPALVKRIYSKCLLINMV